MLQSIRLKEIDVSWDEQEETKKYGKPDSYSISYRIAKSDKWDRKKLTNTKITLKNLELCSQYCIVLNSINTAGISDESKELCSYTLAPSKMAM